MKSKLSLVLGVVKDAMAPVQGLALEKRIVAMLSLIANTSCFFLVLLFKVAEHQFQAISSVAVTWMEVLLHLLQGKMRVWYVC